MKRRRPRLKKTRKLKPKPIKRLLSKIPQRENQRKRRRPKRKKTMIPPKNRHLKITAK